MPSHGTSSANSGGPFRIFEARCAKCGEKLEGEISAQSFFESLARDVPVRLSVKPHTCKGQEKPAGEIVEGELLRIELEDPISLACPGCDHVIQTRVADRSLADTPCPGCGKVKVINFKGVTAPPPDFGRPFSAYQFWRRYGQGKGPEDWPFGGGGPYGTSGV